MSLSGKEFEALVAELQEKSLGDAGDGFGGKGFQRWQSLQCNGAMEDGDASACVEGSCGDAIEIFLKFQGGRVAKATYLTNGCGSSALCGSFTARLAQGKRPQEIMAITPADVLDEIGRFPAADRHCATLSVMALHKALNTYLVNKVPDQAWQVAKTRQPSEDPPDPAQKE